MKYLLIGLVIAMTSSVVYGQQGGRDPNIYLPDIGVPGQIDTIMGTKKDQGLGGEILTLPPRPGSIYGDPLIGDYYSRFAVDTIWTNSFQGGPGFNLHKPESRSRIPFLNGNSTPYFGHFHNSKLIDLFESGINRIYWSDEQGNYDTGRYTYLPVSNDYHFFYSGHLTSDTIDDIIIGNVPFQSGYDEKAVLYKGGEQLSAQRVALMDSAITIAGYIGHPSTYTTMTFADFRGVGRKDLLAVDDSGNLFYYRNDPPFTMEKFKEQLSDTLLSIRENPLLHPSSESKLSRALAFKAFPKNSGDSSVDLAVNYGIFDVGFSVQLFKGGPEFGSHRLHLDHADFIIPNPGLDYSFGKELTDCGDMTGTGDHVLCIQSYGDPITSVFDFYVTGRSLDTKMDMYFNIRSGGTGWIDTVTADGDRLEDVVIGLPGFPTTDPKSYAGTVMLVHGSTRIPHATTGVEAQALVADNTHIWPMPFRNEINLSFESPETETVTTRIYNLLGQEVYSNIDRVTEGETRLKIVIPELSSGTYLLCIRGKSFELKKQLVRD